MQQLLIILNQRTVAYLLGTIIQIMIYFVFNI